MTKIAPSSQASLPTLPQDLGAQMEPSTGEVRAGQLEATAPPTGQSTPLGEQNTFQPGAGQLPTSQLDTNFASQSGQVGGQGSLFHMMLQGGPQVQGAPPAISQEPTAPAAQATVVDVHLDADGDGVTDAARVGVPGMQVPPPPASLPSLPNLTADERLVETRFNQAFESNPAAVTQQYLDLVQSGDLGATNVFSTDAAKMLSPDYNPPSSAQVSPEQRLDRKSRYNTMVHQAGNAIAKRAFVQYLDEVVAQLPAEQRTVLVTAGGVAAGKGYAIENVEEVNQLASQMGAVWDTAGEQNSTELPWVLQECEKRGIHATFVYVHKDPEMAWEHPKFGVLPRAKKKGRMVDARPFSDSYAIGAQNFQNFYETQQANPSADFIFLSCNGAPEKLDGIPQEALQIDSGQLYGECMEYVQDQAVLDQHNPRPDVLRGATVGARIWQTP